MVVPIFEPIRNLVSGFIAAGSPSMDGVIPKAMVQMFQLAQDQAAHATFEFHVTVLEVYNEYVRDLISEQPWEKHEVRQL